MPWVDRFSVAVAAIAWLFAAIRVAPALTGAGGAAWAPALLGAAAGFLLADFVSGCVHWLADRYFDPATPVLGPALIAPFREHHVDALAMTRHDFFEVSGNNALATLPVAAAVALWFPNTASGTAGAGWIGLAAATLSFGLFVIATNQFHCWAHARHRPVAVRTLQRWGLILSPERHRAHHKKAHDCGYCVTSGLMNPVLDGLGFFPALEAGIDRLAARFRPASASAHPPAEVSASAPGEAHPPQKGS